MFIDLCQRLLVAGNFQYKLLSGQALLGWLWGSGEGALILLVAKQRFECRFGLRSLFDMVNGGSFVTHFL